MKDFFKHLKGDAFGGITAGIVALPLALAFGVSSGLGPDAGLYGAIFISFFAALFGGTNTQISGPTAPMTAVSMVIIAGIVAANDGRCRKGFALNFNCVFYGRFDAGEFGFDWSRKIYSIHSLSGSIRIYDCNRLNYYYNPDTASSWI